MIMHAVLAYINRYFLRVFSDSFTQSMLNYSLAHPHFLCSNRQLTDDMKNRPHCFHSASIYIHYKSSSFIFLNARALRSNCTQTFTHGKFIHTNTHSQYAYRSHAQENTNTHAHASIHTYTHTGAK